MPSQTYNALAIFRFEHSFKYDIDIDFSLFCFAFFLQPVFLTLTVNFSSFDVTYTFSALVFSVYGYRFAIRI